MKYNVIIIHDDLWCQKIWISNGHFGHLYKKAKTIMNGWVNLSVTIFRHIVLHTKNRHF